MADPQPVAWRSIVYGTPVFSSDGKRSGEVREVLGSDAEDIFHGLRVGLEGRHRDVMIAADDVVSMTTADVRTSLTNEAIASLPAYDEVATFHLASVGWLRKHLGWRRDDRSDEEPG